MESIADVTLSALKGNLLERVSAQLRESPDATRRGMEQAVPISIAGLAEHASSVPKAESLLGMLHGGDYPRADATQIAETTSDPEAMARLAQSGSGFLSQIFGNKLNRIVDMLAGQSGVSKGSAATLLGLSAPMVLNAVGKEASARNLDAPGLSRFLGEQGQKARGALPAQFAGVLGLGAAGTAAAAHGGQFRERVREGYDDYLRRHPREGAEGREPARTAYRPEKKRSRWPLVAAAIAAIALLVFLLARRGGEPEAAEQTQPTAEETRRAAERTAGAAGVDGERQAQRAQGETEQQAAGETEQQSPQPADQAAQEGQEAAGEVERVAGRETEQAAGAATQTGAAMAGSAGALAAFLQGDGQTPQRFKLEGLEFETDSTTIENSATLDQIADVLDRHESARIRIEGHTDATGDPQQNAALSQQRAEAVKDYLVGRGVAAQRIETAGRGAEQPVASNDTEQGRAQNRRVELVVIER